MSTTQAAGACRLATCELMTERTYAFDVTVSDHDSLKQGVIARHLFGSQHAHHRITVLAEDHTEAFLTAAAMAWRHGMVTGLYPRI